MGARTDIKIDPDIEDLCKEITQNARNHKLILFNDDTHDMMEVAIQVCKATGCSRHQAMQIMLAAHTKGKAVAMTASLEECKKAERILMEIDLRTEIEEA